MKRSKKQDKGDLAIGGGLLLGLGVGFFLLPDGLAFVGSILVGLGLGLIISSLLSKAK